MLRTRVGPRQLRAAQALVLVCAVPCPQSQPCKQRVTAAASSAGAALARSAASAAGEGGPAGAHSAVPQAVLQVESRRASFDRPKSQSSRQGERLRDPLAGLPSMRESSVMLRFCTPLAWQKASARMSCWNRGRTRFSTCACSTARASWQVPGSFLAQGSRGACAAPLAEVAAAGGAAVWGLGRQAGCRARRRAWKLECSRCSASQSATVPRLACSVTMARCSLVTNTCRGAVRCSARLDVQSGQGAE